MIIMMHTHSLINLYASWMRSKRWRCHSRHFLSFTRVVTIYESDWMALLARHCCMIWIHQYSVWSLGFKTLNICCIEKQRFEFRSVVFVAILSIGSTHWCACKEIWIRCGRMVLWVNNYKSTRMFCALICSRWADDRNVADKTAHTTQFYREIWIIRHVSHD